MEKSETDKMMKRIESMRFQFPLREVGHCVDPITHKGTEPEEISDEEGVELWLTIKGDVGERVLKNDAALSVYTEIWKHLRNEDDN